MLACAVLNVDEPASARVGVHVEVGGGHALVGFLAADVNEGALDHFTVSGADVDGGGRLVPADDVGADFEGAVVVFNAELAAIQDKAISAV